MKNLKKLISVIIAVIMIVGSFATVSAADYKDVESTNSFYKAITVLSGLGIVNGDTEGNFNPDNDIKRSEMVALVCRAMGEEDIATASASNAFTDVAANHWAAGYIAWGVNRSIINGMGDGTFAPDASVSYQDAVVMIMRALGYEGIAQRKENGGYPVGYLKLASQYGVLKEAGYDNQAAAPRKIVAQLIYNALTAPLVDFSSFGADASDDKYVIYDGKRAGLQTLLTFTNSIYKVKATVDKTSKEDSTLIDKAGNHKVELGYESAYGYDTDISNGDVAIMDALGVSGGSFEAYVGETNASDLLGATVEAYAYIDEVTGDPILLAIIGDAKATIEETITSGFNTIAIDGTTLEYYAEQTDVRTTKIDLAAAGSMTYYYNGKEIDAEELDGDLGDEYASVEAFLQSADKIVLTGKKADAVYNKIYVTEYTYARVASVDADAKRIKLQVGAIELDAEELGVENYIYNIYDENGVAIALEDIAEDDILNIVEPKDNSFIDIYVTNNTITGKAGEKRNGMWIFDGEAYADPGSIVTSGDEGIFYISIDGKIVDAEAERNISKNFAFILAVGEKDDLYDDEKAYTVKMFTAEGEIVSLDVADKVKFNGTSYKVENNGQVAALGALKTALEAIDNEDADEATAISAVQASFVDRVMTYKLDDAGKISEIFIPEDDTDGVKYTEEATAKYNDEFSEFAKLPIAENAPLFIIPVETEDTDDNELDDVHNWVATIDTDKMTIGSFDALDEDETYDAVAYAFTGDDEELGAALLYENPVAGYKGSALAVLTEIGETIDEDGNAVEVLTFVQAGETVTLKVDNDEYPSGLSLTKGDAIHYNVNAAGDIVDFEQIFDASALKVLSTDTVEDDDIGYIFGVVAKLGSDYMTLASDFTGTDVDFEIAADSSVKLRFATGDGYTFAMYDESNLVRPVVKKISITGIKETVKLTTPYFAVAKVNENDKIEDVIVIRTGNTSLDSLSEINAYTFFDIIA